MNQHDMPFRELVFRVLPRLITRLWQRLDTRWRLSIILAAITALILIGFILFGPSEARLGAVIGLFGLLIAVQAVVLLFIFFGESLNRPPPNDKPQ